MSTEENTQVKNHWISVQKRCDPRKRIYNCCRSSKPCGEGEGNCNLGEEYTKLYGSTCKEGLKCGTYNCRAMHGGDHGISKDWDCCYNPNDDNSVITIEN